MPKTTVKHHIYDFTSKHPYHRAIVGVIIENPANNKKLGVKAILDTGADNCLFPKFVAENLDHDMNGEGVKKGEGNGVGKQKIITSLHEFKIHLLSPNFKSVIWSSPKIEVNCLDGEHKDVLLGVSDFLRHFSFNFNYQTGHFVIHLP